jgi:hypothetical protein
MASVGPLFGGTCRLSLTQQMATANLRKCGTDNDRGVMVILVGPRPQRRPSRKL